jgi:hypothetical protein
MIIDPVGKELRLATGKPVSFVSVPNADMQIEPSFAREDADNLLQYIPGHHDSIGQAGVPSFHTATSGRFSCDVPASPYLTANSKRAAY